jgi:steroid delta-isomerase-like uncharacterized protein
MATSGVERVLDDWAIAWSSHDTEKLLSLFTDDCVYEDVTFGAINHGKKELRTFADGVLAGVPDFKVEMTAQFVAGSRAGMEWVISGTHKATSPGCRPPASASRSGAQRSSSSNPERFGATPTTGTPRA